MIRSWIILVIVLVLGLFVAGGGVQAKTNEYNEMVSQPDFVISRQDWGADETLRFSKNFSKSSGSFSSSEDSDYFKKYKSELAVSKVVKKDPDSGNSLYWPLSYSENVRLFIIHHSATDLPIGKEIESIKAIYYWHSVVRGWGDIGYNYIIDHKGNVYEGRAGGPFVVAGHTSNFNTGSIGIVMLGNFDNTVPTAPSLVALKKLLVSLADIYGIDLEGQVTFREKTDIPTIVGHREMGKTACPGSNFFQFLAYWRKNEDFKSSLVSSLGNVESKKPYIQIPSGSRLSYTTLGVDKPSKVIMISNGKLVDSVSTDIINFPESDSLTLLNYNSNGRSKNLIIESRKDFYGLTGMLALPQTIDLGPGQRQVVYGNVTNNFWKDFSFKNWVESSENSFSILPSFLNNGGIVKWLSGNVLKPGETKKLVFEINAPNKEGVYNTNLKFDIGNNEVLGGQMIGFKVRVATGRSIAENVPYIFDPQEISIRRVRSGNGVITIDQPLTVIPSISRVEWEKKVLDTKLSLLGNNIPVGIKGYILYINSGPVMRFVISKNVPNESYEMFAGINAIEGAFSTKNIEVKFEFDDVFPGLEIGNLLIPDSKMKGREKQVISIKSADDMNFKITNIGNIDFPAGDINFYISNDSSCLDSKSKKLIMKNSDKLSVGQTITIPLGIAPVKASTRYIFCMESYIYKIKKDNVKLVVYPFLTFDNVTNSSGPNIRILLSSLQGLEKMDILSNSAELISSDNKTTKLDLSWQINITKTGKSLQATYNKVSYSPLKKVVLSANTFSTITNLNRNYSWDTSKIYPDNKFRGKIEIYLGSDNTFRIVNVLTLEDYLAGLAESGVADKDEKIKAIVVAARSYAYFYTLPEHRKLKSDDPILKLIDGTFVSVDGTDSPANFQHYVGAGFEDRFSRFGINLKATAGQMLVYNSKVIKAPYFSSDAGKTASAKDVWGWTDTPYLDSKDDHWCVGKSVAGHGVGMSGCGAQGQASEGKTYKEILNYYYPGVEVKKIY